MRKVKRIEFKGIKKYLTFRNILIAALLFVIYLMFSNLAKALLFTALFVPVSILSIKITRVMPHANVEIITPCSFFLGYLYGWFPGCFYGVILGAYIWSTAYSISQFVLLQLFLNGLVAILGNYFSTSLGFSFTVAYFVGMIIRNILFFLLGIAIGGNPLENTIHTITAVLSNLIIMPPFIFLFYNIATIL